MENAGNLREGSGSSNLTPCSWVMKELLENASPSTLTPQYTKKVIDSYSGDSGGTTSAGKFLRKVNCEVPSLFSQNQMKEKLHMHLFMREIDLEAR